LVNRRCCYNESVFDTNYLTQLIQEDPLWYQNSTIQEVVKLFREPKLTRNQNSLKSAYKSLLKTNSFYRDTTGYN